MKAEKEKLYGVVAEFDDDKILLAAANKTREAGYTSTDAHAPIPIHGLAEALGMKRTILPWIVLAGGILGCLGGFFLQYWVSVLEYPLNVGGRPMNSWPSFVPITFECTILGAGVSTILGMLALNGLPLPHHPVFNTPNFHRASDDRYFLTIEAIDPNFELEKVTSFMNGLGAVNVSEVNCSDPDAPLLQ